jgi:UDP-N-acetylglucosamine 3-dehydrogenase
MCSHKKYFFKGLIMKKVCVIGSGAMGRNHIRVLDELEAEIIAIIDTRGIDTVPTKYSSKWAMEFNARLANESDCVIIATPSSTHNSVLKSIVSLGAKNIFIEKPAAIDEQDDQLKNINIYIGFVERHNPAIKMAKKIIDENGIGEIKQAVFTRVGGSPRDKLQSVNVMWDLAVHDVDLMTYLFPILPEFKSVSSEQDNIGTISTSIITYKFGNIFCVSHASWDVYNKKREVKIYGSNGLLEVDLIRQKISLHKAQVDRSHPNTFLDFVFWGESGEKITLEVEKVEPLKAQLIDFLNKVQHNCRMKYSNPALAAIRKASDHIPT